MKTAALRSQVTETYFSISRMVVAVIAIELYNHEMMSLLYVGAANKQIFIHASRISYVYGGITIFLKKMISKQD